jgi:ATP-dependent RNA helicase RhlE
VADDFIHRAGRPARGGAVGEAVTFVAPDEMGDLRAIERAVGNPLPRLKHEGFDYTQRPAERLEIPLAERIAAIRAQKTADRARARDKAARQGQAPTQAPGQARGPGYGRSAARTGQGNRGRGYWAGISGRNR